MSILRSEETEDNALRAQYGTDRWIRQPSRVAHSQLLARIEHFGTILQDAIQSDGVIRAKYGEWAEFIDLLGGDEVRISFASRLSLKEKTLIILLYRKF